ncbi:MAG: phosphatidylglycerophosphatase A [Candidatus Aerophobetes bacterium]|nr:phosphatidylglycerophosphatase A [Candidatus Aerophobetes bacterium]
MKNWITFLGTGFWVGYTPLAPGTMGTLVGVGLYLVFRRILPHPLSYAIMIVVFTGLGVWISGKCEGYSEKKDSKVIVIDEIDGFLITMFALPFSFRFILLGFILFRVFDILKPLKIERIQKLPGGWGIMGDDIAAGVLASIVLHISCSMFRW